nr:uncharacterized protein LOC100182798 isoform X1 [Ciona intestinalis]|eukprot:XP_018672890.1 uncharacterized protein LOC100182798 isoform X1 [Ciona intestinalis]
MERNDSNKLCSNGMNMLLSAIERERQAAEFSFNSAKNTSSFNPHAQNCEQTTEIESKGPDYSLSSCLNVTNPLNGLNLQAYSSPLMFPFISPASHTQSTLTPPAVPVFGSVEGTNVFDLRCVACGLQCKTIAELHCHIMKRHLANGLHASPDLKQSDRISAFSAESQATEPTRLSESTDHVSSSEFPIPTPNFAMLSSFPSLPANGFRPELSSVYPPGSTPAFGVPQSINSIRLPQFPNTYNVINPYLPYSGLLGINGVFPSVTVPANVNAVMPPGYNPYVGFPSVGSPNLLSTRFPFIPGAAMNAALDNNIGTSPTMPVHDKNCNDLVNSKMLHRHLDPLSANSRHTDPIKRRLSAPIISLGKNFKFPHPYNRLAKSTVSSGPSCAALPEHTEQALDPNSYRHASRRSSVSEKQETDDKGSGNRINAKSIEQHISKLISNNEKVLLNPVLERVKPRRVFRRNSLDPASLSSYAASIAGRHVSEGSYPNGEENGLNKMYGDVVQQTFAQDGYPSPDVKPPGISTAEYNKMIELTRAPGSGIRKHSMENYENHFRFSSNDNGPASNRFLGKRNSFSGPTFTDAKKPKRTFFECSDCGVRYRKEENYMIHKQVYCKYKNRRAGFGEEQSFCSSNKPDISRVPYNRNVLKPHNNSSLVTSSSQAHCVVTSSLPPHSIETMSMNQSYADIYRTKIAEAERLHPLYPIQHPDTETTQTGSTDDKEISEGNKQPVNTIPTNKLPPNKRHMHLMRHNDDDKKTESEHGCTGKDSPQKLNDISIAGEDEQFPPSPTTMSSERNGQQWRSISEGNTSTNDLFHFAESSVPRSNYKLLLHQISLRNLQDMGLITKPQTLSVPKEPTAKQWHQAQKNCYVSHLDKLRRSSVDVSPLAQHVRRPSLPVMLPMYPPNGLAVNRIPELRNDFSWLGSSSLGGQISSDRSSQQHYFPKESTIVPPKHTREETVNIHKPLTKADSAVDVNNNNNESDRSNSPMEALPLNKSQPPTISPHDLLQEKERAQNVQDRINTSDVNSTTTELLVSPSSTIDIVSTETKLDSPHGVRISRLLYPHMHPTLGSEVHSTYCSITSPQPTYVEVTKQGDTPLSMYSQWAVSEPILMPPDMTVTDILNCCRRSKEGFRKGVIVTAKAAEKLIVTDTNKAWKSSSDTKQPAIDDLNCSEADEGSDIFVPKLLIPTTDISACCIYTSCCYASSTPRRQVETSDSLKPTESDVASNDCADNVDGNNDEPESSYIDVVSICEKSPHITHTEHDNEPMEKSNDSPRGEDSAKESLPQAIRQAVHPSKTCGELSDHVLRRCSLCSIKAGRSDLVPEATCQICRDFATTCFTKTTTSIPILSTINNSSSTSSYSHSNGYLDKTKALSGSTQHWVSNTTRENQTVFQYPSPNSRKASLNETNSPHSPTPSTTSLGDGEHETMPGNEDGGSVVSPSLAEVVSEVIRSAAIQSKLQTTKKHRLPQSRPLHPLTSPHDISHQTNEEYSTNNSNATHRSTLQHDQVNDSVDTTSGSDATLQHDDEITKSCAKLNWRRLALSSRESQLFLYKANMLQQTNEHELSNNKGGTEDQDDVTTIVNTNDSTQTFHSDDHKLNESDSIYQDSMVFESDDDQEQITSDDVRGSSLARNCDDTARPYKCTECKVAFRTGGHLAKHLRSKGHTVAMQKKTLNRLKMHKLGTPAPHPGVAHDDVRTPQHADGVLSSTVPVTTSCKASPELLDGTGGLARAQVRALFEGNDEYACVPHCGSCDDVITTDNADELHNPRPFKCLACRVAFRFQGHLDRHFRSNLHLIAVGHYDHDKSEIDVLPETDCRLLTSSTPLPSDSLVPSSAAKPLSHEAAKLPHAYNHLTNSSLQKSTSSLYGVTHVPSRRNSSLINPDESNIMKSQSTDSRPSSVHAEYIDGSVLPPNKGSSAGVYRVTPCN